MNLSEITSQASSLPDWRDRCLLYHSFPVLQVETLIFLIFFNIFFPCPHNPRFLFCPHDLHIIPMEAPLFLMDRQSSQPNSRLLSYLI